jgi:hypothetical protein
VVKDLVDQCFEEASAAEAPAVNDPYSREANVIRAFNRVKGEDR